LQHRGVELSAGVRLLCCGLSARPLLPQLTQLTPCCAAAAQESSLRVPLGQGKLARLAAAWRHLRSLRLVLGRRDLCEEGVQGLRHFAGGWAGQGMLACAGWPVTVRVCGEGGSRGCLKHFLALLSWEANDVLQEGEGHHTYTMRPPPPPATHTTTTTTTAAGVPFINLLSLSRSPQA
jgi:hypothetical protein